MFAQVVYLMFSSVYICKETVEHLLLSNGGEVGHHHHHGDEDEGMIGYVVSCFNSAAVVDICAFYRIDFPIILAFITFISLIGTSLIYDNHSKLVSCTSHFFSLPINH
jgi:hypothetical protein